MSIVPLSTYVSNVQCPYAKPPGGDMSLPSWLYLAATNKCYYKSSIAKQISTNIADAKRRCEVCAGPPVRLVWPPVRAC